MRPRYALAIFDFDGTLADSAAWFVSVLDEVAIRHKLRRVTPDELEALRRQDARAVIRTLGVPRWKLPFVAGYMRKLAARDIARIKLFPGIADVLLGLHAAGVRLAVVSSNAEANVRAVLGSDTAALVETYACAVSTFGKAAKFKVVLKRTGVAAHDAIAIGDEIRDIEAAASVGIASGAVAWGYAPANLLRERRPAVLFERVVDIPAELLVAA